MIAQIKVTVESGQAEKGVYEFCDGFRIGRDALCQIRLLDRTVSRQHAEVWLENGQWFLKDLNSANGIYVDGRKTDRLSLGGATRIRLGATGPQLCLSLSQPAEPEPATLATATLSGYRDHYLGDPDEKNIGLHTMMVRRTFAEARRKQKKKYLGLVAVAVCLALAAGIYAYLIQRNVSRQKKLAEDIFYHMKALEVEIAKVSQILAATQNEQARQQFEEFKGRQKELQDSYQQFVDTLKIYGKGVNEQEKSILKMARIFGECEINMPKGFVREVEHYIEKWRSSRRLEEGIQRAVENGYVEGIVRAMRDQDLPPQFFYLALQESGFNIDACGPATRFGIAKGMWQFIPATAAKYGLRPGPRADEAEPDPRDDRHHFGRSTLAAARYLKDIYATDAQASGLLVMAAYNWGERRVIELIRSMPHNPRERNFWRLLENYRDKIPRQTYDYVFYIFSAAVIGENPRLFGFDFDNPLQQAEKAS
jgi:membrane-bound lytic murein transglycosylase D